MKTYNEIDIKYYDNDGNIQVRCSAPVTQDALVHYELMQSHYCKLSFKLSKPIYFLLGDFIDTPYGRFELIDLTKAKDNDTIGYSYEILFDAYYRKFKNKILKYRPNTGSQEATFSLTSTISTHVEVIMKSLAYYAKLDKSYLYDPKFEGEGTDYTYVIDASVDANAAKLITYSNTSMLDAIANIAQTFGCEWWFEGNILHFGTCENTNAITDFRLNDNIVSMSSSQSQSTYANRVYAFGAARNLPSGYKNDADADITKDGVVEKRLMLPNSAECSDKNKQLLAENGFELKNGYIQVSGLREDQYVEGVTTNDDIYPRNLIKTSKVTSYEKDVEDESTPEEGDFIKRTFYRVNSLSIINEDGEKTGDMAFRKSYILSGKNLHIVFQSGSLNGMDFECEFNPDGVEEILKDDDGNPILKDGKEQINPKSQVFEIVANEDYGRFLPDTTLHPKEGDTFVLYNWDSTKLGDTLVSAASNELLTDAIKDLKKSMIDPTTYTCTAEANYSYNQGRGNLHGVGDRVNLYNKGYGDSYRASRIIGYEFCLDIPYDGAKYYVGEKPSYSRLNAMESKIEELVYNGQSYLNGNGGGGKSIYIIKSYDKTAPTDYNVYSARAIDEQRLNKTKDDTAQGTITFEKVQKFLKGMKVGANGDWTLDELDNTHLTIDYLQVRMKAIFETLEILHTDTLGGELFITSVGSNRILKVEEVNITYDGVSQKAYRCYFLGEQDGSKVENKWKVGDQARSKSFNLTQGKYHNVGNHYYWRLVIGVSSEAVEIDGKKYHYVDLSDIDKDAASDEPMVDDILNQCGNRTDITRQSCLVFSAVDTYSPCITLYHGVDGYTFNNKEYVNYGVNHSTNKAFFHVYGDMYFGDRPTSANNYEGDSYVKYDSDKKKVTIKGDLDIKSTYDGKTLDKYITEKSLDKNAVETIIKKSETITDLQNQIDGAIETWFYDGVPTLSNAPAIGWTTDKDKKTHLGDLYYDNKTGKAYRFAKDGSTYKWIIITDTELTKAIEDSSQALKDAKSKRRIFGSQPVPPYDVNDMWVNATYPSDGSTYKNEILKCSSSKAEGEEFDIADWKLASKYTDDTKAEEAKKAAEKAQAEIKNTQTNLIALGTTVSNNKKAFDVFTSDGYLDSSEIAAIAQDSKRLEDDYNAAVESYNNVVGSKFLLDKDGKETTYKTDLVSAKATLDSAKNELITYLSDIVSRYNASDSNGKATIKAAAAQKYTNFTNAYKAFYDKLGVANNYITSNLFDGLNTKLITNMAGLEYIKAALVDGDTVVKGGLILSTLIALRNDKGNVTAGINGADTKENGIALWLGGKAIDKQASTTTEEEKKIAAKSLLRFDGTGYFANGNLWWDADGTLHADPTSFIINKNNVGVQLALFAPVWKSGTTDTTKLANVLSIDPQKPFTHLDVSGNVTTEGSLKIGGIYLSYDSANNALRLSKDAAGKEAANFYTTGGITAYGAGASTTGGGGLIASVISYARILEGSYTDADLTSIPNAYAIKALSSRIDNIATELGGLNLSWNNITGKPSTFTPSAHTHKWTEITDRITKVSQLTNDKGYLTAHQSLASYYTKAEIDAKGYTTNKGTVTSVALTLPTGLTCATKTITTSGTFAISLASGYSIPTTTKQTAWDGAVSAKHTHSNKSVLDDISSTKVSRWNSAYDWYALMTTDEETADGIINKWNEVVSFLANIAQTDTLSGIVDGINKSISDEVTRAKKAEGVNASGISTNKTSITTLQGYFTSGSAKKALQLTNTHKLWGNSFNGTADINGSIIVPDGKYISIGNIKMEYDATNKALKITNTTTNEVANLYTSGGVSAYGVGTSSSSGGGLNGSVKSYSNALKLTSESLSEIASAYSIKALDSRISSLEGGSAMDVSVSGSGNAVTSISKSGTTISVVKGATFLTAHQSLSAYMKTADAKALFLYHTRENIVTDLDNFITNGASHIYELHNVANAPTDNSWLQVMNWGSIDKNYGMLLANDYSINGNLYFRQKVAGKWEAWKTLIDSSNIASQSVKYATTAGSANAVAWTNVSGRPSTMKNPSALSWSGYSTGSYDGSAAKSISIPNNTNQLTNGAGFITASASITGNAATATKVNHSLSVFGKSFNGSADVTVADTDLIASISTGTANLTDKTEILTSYASDNGFNDSNAKNKIHRRPASAIWGYINSKTISNADKLDNVHLNGIFTALSNTNNGVSMTIGTVAKSLANMQVYSATKLVTARNIALGHDFRGSANFDGSGNITINGHINFASINLSSTDPNPFKRIAHVQTAKSWNDNALLLYLSQGYIGGNVGICRVEFRTNDVTETGSAGVNVRWLVRYGYVSDSVQVGYYSAKGNSYMDVFVKTTGGYQGTVIRCLQDSRGGINSNVSLFAATQTTEAYTSIEAAAKALYNLAYTYIVKGSDVGTVNYANSAGNSDTLDGIHANGLFTNLSNSGNNLSITIGGTNKTLTVKYAASAGNADTLDGVHASGLFTNLSNSGNNISITIGGTNKTLTAAYATNCDTVDGYHAQSGSSKPYGKIPVIGTDGVIELGHFIDFHHDNTTGSDYSVRLQTNGNHSNVVTLPTATGTLALISDNVASATKLQTPRTIWGQSFDGTGNVNGTIYINNSDSENGAIILNNNVNTHARISAIKDQVVFNTGAAIRFGATNWEYSDWAGLKYDTVANAIYLGIADGTVFNYYSNKRSNGTLKFPGITTITPDSGARIGGSGADLFLGNANNSAWVKVQDICSQTNSSLWSIRQDGNAYFKNIYSGAATINGNLSVDGLISNKGILPANYEFNNKGTSCYVSADALCSGITAITDSIQINQVTVQYSNDSGNSWTNYPMGNDAKFNLYASNAGLTQVYLGYNVITGNNDAEKLAQVKKNELMVTFEISNNCYSQVYFASVDISNGIDTICTVECLNNSGAVVRTYTKHVTGWNQVNYINISEGNAGYGLGHDSNRYIRFRFKHDQKTTALRNTVINKIRIFSFTKYSFPTDRFMGHTGHIYNFDYNMNTYFPNSILAKGGVTAYQSSDIRLKQDLRKLDYFGIIKAMGGTFGFAWKKDNTRSIGWIAQHVLCNPHLKDIVETDEKGYYKINYWSPKLIATAFGAIEQVGDEVSRLKARVVFLESEVQRLSGDKEDCNKKRLDNKNINSLN